MPPRRRHDPALLARARLGELTRTNTRPGTPERSAADRVAYLRRREEHSHLTAREATGHRVGDDVDTSMSAMVASPPRFVVFANLSRPDRSRLGRYGDLSAKLDAGRITPAEFRRRVRRWRPIASEHLLSDPDAVLRLLDERRAQDLEIFVYERGATA
jgi:hypothetical protein